MDHELLLGISHLAFNTKNLADSLHFYCDLLGFQKKFEIVIPKDIPDSSPFAALRGRPSITYIGAPDGSYIEIFTERPDRTPRDEDENRIGYAHLSLQVSDIRTALEQLRAEGVRIDSEVSLGPDKTYQAWIRDPDDNRIELMEYTDQSLQL